MLKNNSILKILRDAMGSEHTSYTSTKKFLARLPTKGKYVIQGPGENAGIVDLGKGWALALRIESHNHPSFIKPWHGAATGVGGILRDIFTMGARPIALLDFLRFGIDKRSKYLLKEIVKGISDYGNCIGVPTIGGDIYFDKTYNNNCLVNVAAFGIVRKKNIIYGSAKTPGSELIYVGARTGRDGIGGAQMASENLDTFNNSAIQDADPFLEKLLLEACCELAETDWIEGMQDMGAAGLLCSTTEIAIRGKEKTGLSLGTKIYLDRIPTKSKRMSITDLLLSESQERMLIVGKRQFRDKILSLFKYWDLEARVIGNVTDDGKYTLINRNKEIKINFDDIFLDQNKSWKANEWISQKSKTTKASIKQIENTWHQYDWTVGTRTIKGPDKPGNYAILDLPEVGKNLIISWSSDEGIANVSPSKGINYAFDKCLKTIRKIGGVSFGLVNCLNFGHPKDSMGAFAQTIDALSRRCKKENVPVVGGNVSLYNAYKDHSIKPTSILVMVGVQNL